MDYDHQLKNIPYVCGNRRCGKQTVLKISDAVKCEKCGYRILFKKRRADQAEPIQYDAV